MGVCNFLFLFSFFFFLSLFLCARPLLKSLSHIIPQTMQMTKIPRSVTCFAFFLFAFFPPIPQTIQMSKILRSVTCFFFFLFLFLFLFLSSSFSFHTADHPDVQDSAVRDVEAAKQPRPCQTF